MKKKVKNWLDAKGRRLVELKLLGGGEIYRKHIQSGLNKLTTYELIEFLQLSGQLQAIIWLLAPKDENKYDIMTKEISNYLHKFEKELIKIRKITGIKRVPKGKA